MRAAQPHGTSRRGAAPSGGKSPPVPKTADALVSRPTPEAAVRQLASWAPPVLPARAASPRVASPSVVRFGYAAALSPPPVHSAGVLSPRASLPTSSWPLLHHAGATAPALPSEPRVAPVAPVALGGVALRRPAAVLGGRELRWDLQRAPLAAVEALALPRRAAPARGASPARPASPRGTLAYPAEPVAGVARRPGESRPPSPPSRGAADPPGASHRGGEAESPRRRSSARAPPAPARAARREAAQGPRPTSRERPGSSSPRAALAGGARGAGSSSSAAPCHGGEAAKPLGASVGRAFSPRDDFSAGRAPEEPGHSGGTASSPLERLRQDKEDLLQQNASLQERLLKARSSASAAQRQADEALAERDREHLRAESLQKSSQQLLRKLRRETARAQQLEAELHKLRSAQAAETRMHAEAQRPQQAQEAAGPRQGLSAAPPHAWDELDLGDGMARSARSHLGGGSAAGRDDEDAILGLASPIVDGSCAGGGGGARPAAEAAEGAGSFTRQDHRAAAPPTPREPRAAREEGPAGRLGGPGRPPAPAERDAAQKSWEFVVQGQHEAEPQQDFAAKILSCYPDDAIDQAQRKGVACICTRGRRLDSSVPNQDDFVAARHTLVHGGHIALYGVFDGFGPAGHHCAAFARGHLPESLFGQRALLLRPEDTLREAFRLTQEALLAQPFDSAHSGVAAVLCLVLNLPTPEAEDDCRSPVESKGEAWLFVAHVGDSRAILASHSGADSSAFTVTALTRDHRPDDAEEADRVVRHGGEVRRMHDGAGARRVFARGLDQPALALTRCLGAVAAAGSGVSAEPEVSAYRLRPGVDVLLVLGTDGLFEFCSNTHVVGQVLKDGVSVDTLAALSETSRRQWAQSSYNETVDDITIVAAELPSGEPEAEAGSFLASPRRR